MFYEYSLLSEFLHKALSIQLFVWCVCLALVLELCYIPKKINPWRHKYLSDLALSNYIFIFSVLAYGWICFALGEWIVLLSVFVFIVVVTVLVIAELYKRGV